MTIIYFILVLGITVSIHEFGHFICAKKSKVHVYEFSIGMGPAIKTWRRKNDETQYSLRLFPIGGYVSMAGEDSDEGDDDEIPDDKKLMNKPWINKFATVIAGIVMNFILALVIFFIVGLISGVPAKNSYISEVEKDSPSYNAGLKEKDEILKVNGKSINSDMLLLKLAVNKEKPVRFTVKHDDNTIENIIVTPEENDGEYKFGFGIGAKVERGFFKSIKYAFFKFASLITQMISIIGYLLIGKLKLNNLSGPVGIFQVVGQASAAGFINVIYLLGYLSLNVGFINLLPIPAFDGGRLLFLIIEKIKGSSVNPKVENLIHTLGFAFLLVLMVVITYNDIVRIIH